MGHLDISDPDKVHAIGLPMTGSAKWGWRVYLPKNRQFKLYSASGRIPSVGTAGSFMSTGLPLGEFLLYASVQKGGDGRWEVATGRAGGGGVVGIAGSWPDEGRWSIEGVRPEEPQTVEPGKPLVLLRLRALEEVQKAADGTPTAWSAPKGDSGGVMLWIQEVNSKP
jgi:hypothetical protein